MKKIKHQIKILIIIIISIFPIKICPQGIDSFFVNFTDKLIPILSKQQRIELLEYAKVNLKDSVPNRFGRNAIIAKLDSANQHIVVKPTQSNLTDLKMFTLNENDTVIGVIQTITQPISISCIKFYDMRGKIFPLQFNMPVFSDWLRTDKTGEENIDSKWLKSVLANSFVSLRFADEEISVIAVNHSLDFLSEEDRKIIAQLMSDKSLVFSLQQNVWIKVE